jgi:hypothetical protein
LDTKSSGPYIIGSVFITFLLHADDFLDGGTTLISALYKTTHNTSALQNWLHATEAELCIARTLVLDCSIGLEIHDVGVLFGIEGKV